MSENPTPPTPPPFTRVPEGEIPWEDAADVITLIFSILAGLVFILIALGVRRMRQNERALMGAKAAKALRDKPPGVISKSDLTAVEKAARTMGGDVQAFLDALARCEVLASLAQPCTPAATAAMRAALAGKATWPEEPADAAAAGALLHSHLHSASLPAKGVWPRGVAVACEYAREAIVEVCSASQKAKSGPFLIHNNAPYTTLSDWNLRPLGTTGGLADVFYINEYTDMYVYR